MRSRTLSVFPVPTGSADVKVLVSFLSGSLVAFV